ERALQSLDRWPPFLARGVCDAEARLRPHLAVHASGARGELACAARVREREAGVAQFDLGELREVALRPQLVFRVAVLLRCEQRALARHARLSQAPAPHDQAGPP